MSTGTLLLNRDMLPISILPLSVIDWTHAMKLYFLGKIQILEVYEDKPLRSEHITMFVPAVAMTNEYFNYKKAVKFSRHNLYLRDLYQCQYCGDTFDSKNLTIDHVIPRKDGGRTEWNNCSTACKTCNSKKGHKLWKPLNEPYKPDYYNLVKKWKNRHFNIGHPSWHDYLGLDHREADAEVERKAKHKSKK